MHPLKEFACDELLENPLLKTPPPEEEKPRPPAVRKPRVFKHAPRFPLLSKEFYNAWCNHQKELQKVKPIVEQRPPDLIPELYLKPRRLDNYARDLEQIMNTNKELLKRINYIQRTGGFVDCRSTVDTVATEKYKKLLCLQRQRELDALRKSNMHIYSRLLNARSDQPLTKEMEELWKDTKEKLILGASIKGRLNRGRRKTNGSRKKSNGHRLPFILFKTEKIDKSMRDPAFDKPLNVHRPK